jgi:hypothetical protein
VVIKKAIEARKAYLVTNPKVIKQRVRFNEDESPLFAKLGKLGWIIGASIAVIAFVLLFVAFNGSIGVTETKNIPFKIINLMFGLTSSTYGELLRSNILVLVGVVSAVLATVFAVLGKFLDGKKPIITVLSTVLYFVAGLILIFAIGGLNKNTSELYIFSASTWVFWVAGILFIIAGLFVSHKYSFKGLRFLVWFLVNNIGVVVCILCFIGVFLYWTGRIT